MFVCEKKVKGLQTFSSGEYSSLFIKPFAAQQPQAANGNVPEEPEADKEKEDSTIQQPMHFDHAAVIRKFKVFLFLIFKAIP